MCVCVCAGECVCVWASVCVCVRVRERETDRHCTLNQQITCVTWSRSSSVTIVTMLRAGRPETQVPTRHLSPLRKVQTGTEAHTLRKERSFSGLKRSVREVDHLCPSRAEVENEWRCTSTSLSALMACAE